MDVGSTSVPGTRTVVLDLTWSGGMLVTQPKTKFITILPGQRSVVTQADASRQTDSVTGSLILDGIELLGQAQGGIGGFVASHAVVDAVRTR